MDSKEKAAALSLLREKIGTYPDFPKCGITFKDVFSLFNDADLLSLLMKTVLQVVRDDCPDFDVIVGLDSRGFLFGPTLALQLGKRFVPIRKKGKLPGKTLRVTYQLEYGSDQIEIQENSIHPKEKVLVIDDLLATGGTMAAACELLNKVDADIVCCLLVIELSFLEGRKKIAAPLISMVQFNEE